MNRVGYLTYKCRRCEAIIENCTAPDIELAIICLTGNHKLPWPGQPVGLTDIHHCDETRIGVADLIGGRLKAVEPSAERAHSINTERAAQDAALVL